MNNQPFTTQQGICEFPPPHSYCKSQQEQVLVGYVCVETKKFSACEICYQETKKNQWQINWEKKLTNVKWFYFYDENRQKLEDQAQLADFNHRQELAKNKEPKNEHRAWFVDQSAIDFLWEKGWNCCQRETCEWWESVNKHLKKDLFTSEEEWQNFKEFGIYPAKIKKR